MKTYRGVRQRGACNVTVDGQPLPLGLDVRSHSPTGFEWGYGGSGPAQLALAILLDCLGRSRTLCWYQEFKFAVIASLDRESWELSEEQVRAAVERLELNERLERARETEECRGS